MVQQYANIRAHGFGKRGQQVTERLRTVVQRSCGIMLMVDIYPARLFESPCWFWVAPGGKGGQARDAIKAVNAMKEYTTSRKLRRDWAGDEDFKARSGGCGTLPERADESLVIFLRDIRHGKEIDGKN